MELSSCKDCRDLAQMGRDQRRRIAELEAALEEIFERVAGSAFYQTERKILEIKRIAEQALSLDNKRRK